MKEESTPNPWTIHRRFATALLRETLAGAGKLHVDYRVDTERETIRYFEPRRSANDPDPVPPPDPDPHKQLARSLFEASRMRAVEVEVGGEPDFIDLYFVPSRGKPPAPGLLGQMTRKETILRVLHTPPALRDAREGLRLALDVWELHRRKSKAKRVRRVMPETWVIGTGAAKDLPEQMGARPGDGWPAGLYLGARMLPVHMVALRELSVSQDTLVLRLLGTGDLLESALAEQAALPEGSPVRRAAQAALAAACPAEGEPVPIDEATKDPILRACRKTYRRWAGR